MRAPTFLLAVFVIACGSDHGTDGTLPTTPTTPTSSYSITVDSLLATRTAVVGTSVPAEVHVTQNGQTAVGVTITWAVSTGGGTANPVTSVTNSSGVAKTTWTLSDTVRVATLTGAITGETSADLKVTTIAGPATAVVKVGADSVAVVSGASTLLTAKVTDKTGNPVTGASIAWTANGGSVTPTTSVTGPSGNGQVVFSTGGTPRSYTVTATVAGIGALTFKVVGL